MNKPTKHSRLIIRLKSGVRVNGRFHVAKETHAAVRPSAAIGESRGGFILLSDVDVCENGESTKHPSIMVNVGDISYIQLPECWDTDDASDVAHDHVCVP